MPRIKRWFPMDQDTNSNPIFNELCDKFGAAGIRIWIELQSISDRNDGEVPGDYQALMRPLSGRCQTTGRRVIEVLEFLNSRLWIASQSPIKVLNYAELHNTRDANKIPSGKNNIPSLTIPNHTVPNQNNNTLTSIIPLSQKSAPAAWPESDLWILRFLETQSLLALPASALKDPKWWEQVSYATNGIDLQFLEKEFAKMGAWVGENPARKPTKDAGWKRFVRGWLERSYEKERRFSNGSQRQTYA